MMVSKITFDVSGLLDGLNKLTAENRYGLARSMAVAGGKVLRDEAKRNAPLLKIDSILPGSDYRPEPGLLRKSIYLAFKPELSSNLSVTYSVSWNRKVAFYAYFIEFGHLRYNSIIDGVPLKTLRKLPNVLTTKSGKPHGGEHVRKSPQPIAARPFLRPAYDLANTVAKAAMLERGRARIREILNGS